MKLAALALASTFALAIGCAQPALAQMQNANGNQPYAQDQSDMDNGNATTGANVDEQNGNWNDDNGERGWNGWRHHHGSQQGRMGMGSMMWRRHQMMLNAMGGAHFRFARGKARIDIRCPAQGNLQACVHAATQLLDKIAELRNGGGNSTTGSADDSADQTSGSAVGHEPGTQGDATPGSTTPDATDSPTPHGEHM